MSKEYETVIGLEVHVELATKTKIFCGCSTAFGGAPNTHTCPVCTGMPGSLPVLNKQVVEYAVAVGLAVAVYLGLGPVIGKETASWVCILAAAPIALAGFFNYNGMTLEQFAWAFIKSEILCAGERRFVSRNYHYELLKRKGGQDFD